MTTLRVFRPHHFDLYYGDYEDIIRNANGQIHSSFGILQIIIQSIIICGRGENELLKNVAWKIYQNERLGFIKLDSNQRKELYGLAAQLMGSSGDTRCVDLSKFINE
jgi:hypothetical protein